MLPAQPNQSLIDGLTCLQTLAMSAAPLGVRELARQVGMNPMRVNRLVKTLAHLGMTSQTTDRKYVSGPAMHVLSAQSLQGSGLLRRALGPLESLKRFGLDVALGVLWQDLVCYLYHTGNINVSGLPVGGQPYRATRSSIGRVLLAAHDDDEIRRLYAGRDIPDFPGGLADLRRELRLVRKQGYALIVMAKNPLRITVAAPLGKPPYAAVAVTGVTRGEKIKTLIAGLKDAAKKIESADDLLDKPAKTSIKNSTSKARTARKTS